MIFACKIHCEQQWGWTCKLRSIDVHVQLFMYMYWKFTNHPVSQAYSNTLQKALSVNIRIKLKKKHGKNIKIIYDASLALNLYLPTVSINTIYRASVPLKQIGPLNDISMLIKTEGEKTIFTSLRQVH